MPDPRGSALLIMLWAVALLAATVLGLARYLGRSLDEDASRAKAFRARNLAESGLAIALHPAVAKFDPLLRQTFGPAESFSVRITAEGARLNINTLLDEEKRPVLLDLFTAWGLELSDADHVIDSLMDWTDADDLARLSGAERPDYAAAGLPHLPRNKPFQDVEEMALCAGMEMVDEAKPDWRDSFTVYGGGKLDINDAPAALIEIVARIEPLQAEAIVTNRAGPDGIEDTVDDTDFTSLDQVRTFLGLNDLQFAPIADRITINDPVVRIRSTGRAGDYWRTLAAVVQKGGQGGGSSVLALIEE